MKKLFISFLRDCGYSLSWKEDRSKVYFGASLSVVFCLACSTCPMWLFGLALFNLAVSMLTL